MLQLSMKKPELGPIDPLSWRTTHVVYLNAPVVLLQYPGLGSEKLPTALCCFCSRGIELENVVHTLMHLKAQVSLNAEHA
jgi:hypothetical protein